MTVRGGTLADILRAAGPRVRLLKLDCEGAEQELLACEDLSRVDEVRGEAHDWCSGRTGHVPCSSLPGYEELRTGRRKTVLGEFLWQHDVRYAFLFHEEFLDGLAICRSLSRIGAVDQPDTPFWVHMDASCRRLAAGSCQSR